MRGGYQILDLKHTAFTSGVESTVEGAFNQIARSNGKRIVVEGLTVGNANYNDFEMFFIAGNNIFEGSTTIGSDTVSISVDYENGVTVTVA